MTDRQITPQQSSIATSLQGVVWRKSSFSGTEGNCVELATGLVSVVAVRDSKDPDAAVLIFTREQWRVFARQV